MNRSLSGILSAPFALLVLLVAACSGHGSSSIPAVAPHASGAGANTAAPKIGVKVKLIVPRKPASTSVRRKRQYVSYETESAEVIVNGGSPVPFAVSSDSPDCYFTEGGGFCDVTVDAPAGSDTFTMKTFDEGLDSSGNASGDLLSSGTAVQTITAGAGNEVDLTLDGVVASFSVAAEPSGSAVGSATSLPVYVTAHDADGNAIIGPGSYIDTNGNPVTITVSDADASGTTTITNPTVTMPDASSVPSFNYNGSQLHGTAPTITASATGFTSATDQYRFAPELIVVVQSLGASPSAMTAGSDGAIYMLESVPGTATGSVNAAVEKYVIGGSADSTFTYTGCSEQGFLNLNPGIVSAADGKLYIATNDDCGQTETAEIVGMTTGGTFTNNMIADNAVSDFVFSSTALGYPGTGTSVQLVATVTPGPNASPSSSPPAIGPSFVTSSTSGTANSYAFRTALGLSATDTYSFSSVAGANLITYDSSGNAWLPETIDDTTLETSTNVIVHANSSTAGSFAVPQPSGATESIVAVTTGSDGKIWYVGNQLSSAGQTIVIGNVTTGGTFTEYAAASNNPAGAVSNAIVEGSDAALYTVVSGNIVRAAHDGTLTSNATGSPPVNGNVTSGLKMSNGDIYFTGTDEYQQSDEEFIEPALFQLLY